LSAFIITLHIIACIVLIVLVLLQSGKEGMGVIFGGGSSSVFGSAGAGGFLVKMTAWFAALFLVTCLTYNYLTMNRGKASVMGGAPIQQKAVPVENKSPLPEGQTTNQPEQKPAPAGAAQTALPGQTAQPAQSEQKAQPAQTPQQKPAAGQQQKK